MRALGLMSGTSLDGIDVALIETDGERVLSFGPHGTMEYSSDERALLREAMLDARTLTDRTRIEALAVAAELVVRCHIDAVGFFLFDHGLAATDIDLIGFHGQTVLHRPEIGLTIQLGDGAALAKALGIPVMYDMRAADVAAGGQGAPLVPVFHQALARNLGGPFPLAVLNLGGVGNITWLDVGADPVACDTGPGNALLNDFMLQRAGCPMDRDGLVAAKGRPDMRLINQVLAREFFRAPPPKSLDRDTFAGLDLAHLSLEDGAATLTLLTALSVARVVQMMPRPPMRWIVAGGGARNPTMMRMLADALAPASVETAEAVGWAGDALEAQAFAFLAVRALRSLPLTFPTTTGCPSPLSGGVLARP